MDLDNKISQAKAKLLVEYPLFGTLASKLALVKNDDIQNFKSNGIKLEYNEDYLQRLEVDELAFVFANGAMHASLAHERRKNRRSLWLWQLATDYAINDMLVQNGFHKPIEAHYSTRFSGLYAEEIYEILKDDFLKNDIEYDEHNADELQNDSNSEADEELFAKEAEAKIIQELKYGENVDYLERFFKITCSSKVSWRDELKAAIERFHKDDYTLLPPSKKFLHVGIYLPSCISQKFKMVVAIDSSGSIDKKLLDEFLSELNFLMNTISNYEIELLVCDDKIQSHKTFYNGDILEVELQGGGATDFRAVFDFIENELEDVKLLLYFTDLDGVFPTQEPPYEVKWVSKKEGDIPFGTIIMLE